MAARMATMAATATQIRPTATGARLTAVETTLKRQAGDESAQTRPSARPVDRFAQPPDCIGSIHRASYTIPLYQNRCNIVLLDAATAGGAAARSAQVSKFLSPSSLRHSSIDYCVSQSLSRPLSVASTRDSSAESRLQPSSRRSSESLTHPHHRTERPIHEVRGRSRRARPVADRRAHSRPELTFSQFT